MISGGKRIFVQLSDFFLCPRRLCFNIPSSLVNNKTESNFSKLQKRRNNRTFPQTAINAGVKGPSGEVSRKVLQYPKPIWSIRLILPQKKKVIRPGQLFRDTRRTFHQVLPGCCQPRVKFCFLCVYTCQRRSSG